MAIAMPTFPVCCWPDQCAGGQLANFLTKLQMLELQEKHGWPCMAMVEDDIVLNHKFVRLLSEAADAVSKSGEHDRIQLGELGEAYVTSLRGAKKLLVRWAEVGIQKNIDDQLRDAELSGPQTSWHTRRRAAGAMQRADKPNAGVARGTPDLPGHYRRYPDVMSPRSARHGTTAARTARVKPLFVNCTG